MHPSTRHDQSEPDYCPFCGTEVPENLAYCPKCGQDARFRSAPKVTVTPRSAQQVPGLFVTVVLTVVLALVMLLSGCILSVKAAVWLLTGAAFSAAPGLVALLAFASLGTGLTGLGAGYGLWHLRPWGLRVTRIVYLAMIPLQIMLLLLHGMRGGALVQTGLELAIDAGILVFLSRAETRALFTGTE